jgi:hypothetical protein
MFETRHVLGLIIAAACTAGVACGGKGSGAKPPSQTLRVTGIAPTSGSPDGGQPITIHGEGFMGESRTITVFFGDSQAQVIDIPSDTEVKIEAPPGPAGQTVDVSITFDPGGEIKLPAGFTFTGDATAPPPVPVAMP